MIQTSGKFLDLRIMEEYSRMDSRVHRLAPEAKVVTTVLFLIIALSSGRYEIADLLPFFLYPLVLLRLSGLPLGKILRRSLLVLPFIFFIGIFNPLFDTAPMVRLGGVTFSGGWVSFGSILLRGMLTGLTALTLISTTGFPDICSALSRLGVPALFITQLLLLYHSLHILLEEGGRMYSAWKLRSFDRGKMPLRVWGSLLGTLFLRSLDRSGRLHTALMARGFKGSLPSKSRTFLVSDAVFLLTSTALFLIFRFASPASAAGRQLERLFS